MNINTKEENNLNNDINIDINKNDKNKNVKKISKKDSTKKDKGKKDDNMIIKGTLKLDKIHYLVEKKDNKLFEDVNLQYMEPLEGSERDSEKGENSYNNYLKGVNEELNLKEKEITFINDLGLKNNLLNIKEIFDKIKKQNKLKILKTQNSLKSINKIILKQ